MVKKKKLRLSKSGKTITFIFLGIFISLALIGGLYAKTNYHYKKLGYRGLAITNIYKYNLKKLVDKEGHNKTLSTVLASKDYLDKNRDIYLSINYKEQADFTRHINELLDKGYKETEINDIIRTGTNDEVEKFIKHDYLKKVSDYLGFPYAKLSNIDRYYAYQKEEFTDNDETVVKVNIGLDLPLYDKADVITEDKDNVLANKYHQLGDTYIPNNLVDIDDKYCLNKNQRLVGIALESYLEMLNAATKEGLTIYIRSAYRSYKEQEELYQYYVKNYGVKKADSISARPGFSEHQTGLVVDVAVSKTGIFTETKEFKWMKENAYKYGFILRYPKGKEKITTYNYEAWHYRYVGVDIAKDIVKKKLTFDEYYVMYLDK
ncbi:MAG: M15 family metallopeptidase [Bacilli bacterium]